MTDKSDKRWHTTICQTGRNAWTLLFLSFSDRPNQFSSCQHQIFHIFFSTNMFSFLLIFVTGDNLCYAMMTDLAIFFQFLLTWMNIYIQFLFQQNNFLSVFCCSQDHFLLSSPQSCPCPKYIINNIFINTFSHKNSNEMFSLKKAV